MKAELSIGLQKSVFSRVVGYVSKKEKILFGKGEVMGSQIGIRASAFLDTPLEVILKKATEYEVSSVELSRGTNVRRQNVYKVKDLLAKYKIKAASVNNGLVQLDKSGKQEIETAQKLLRESIEIAEVLGSKVIIIYCPCEDFAGFRVYMQNLRPCLKACEDKNIIMALENEPAGITSTAKGILRIIEEADSSSLKINYDPDNFYNAREEAFPFAYEILKEHIAYIHAKDSVKYDESLYGPRNGVLHRKIDVMCVPLGDGALNWEGLSKRLRKDKYDGFIVIEPNVIPEELDRTFRHGVQYLKSVLTTDRSIPQIIKKSNGKTG